MTEYRVVDFCRRVFVVTCVAACGPQTSTTSKATTNETGKTPAVTAAIDAPIPDEPPPPQKKLVCAPATTIRAAPMPEATWFCVKSDGQRHGPFLSAHPDGATALTGTYADGVLHGAWQSLHPNGQPREVGEFAEGAKTGKWQRFSATGTQLGEYTMTTGSGVVKDWYETGQLYSERPLVNGLDHGTSKIFALDGSLLGSTRFYKGKLDGKHEFGTRNTMRIEETFSGGVRTGKRTVWQFWTMVLEENYDRRGKFHGPYTAWRNKKTPRFKGDYDHGKKTGPWVWTDKENTIEREGTYVDNKRDGVWNEYWEKKLTFTGTYTRGKPDGTFIYNDRNGHEVGRFEITDGTGTMLTFHGNKKPSSREKLYKGSRDGVYQELTTRGKVTLEGHYASNVRHGSWKEWTLDGVLMSEATYKRGKLDGVVKKYVDGKLSTESTWREGKAEGPYAELRDGKPAVTGQFANDRKTGTWTHNDPTGSVTLVATYVDGVLDGPWKQQLAVGVVLEGTMTAGRRTGTWTRTDKGVVKKIDYDVTP